MASRNPTSSSALERSTNVLSYDAASSVLIWFQGNTNPGGWGWGTLFKLQKEQSNSYYYDELGVFNYPGTGVIPYSISKNNSTSSDGLGATNLSTNTWYCMAYVRASDTDRKLYIGSRTALLAQDGSTITAPTGSRTTNPANYQDINYYRDGVFTVGNVITWARALSLAELQAQQFLKRPVSFTNINSWVPFLNTGTSRGKDYTGNGDFAGFGTAQTDYDNPPLSYGAPSIILPWVATSSGATGSLTATLGELTLSAAGQAPAIGFLTATLGTLGISAAGISPIKGTLSATLGAVTLTANGGTTPVIGSLTVTLGAATVSAAGVSPVKGTLNKPLGDLSVSAAGVSPIKGAANLTLGALTVSTAGASQIKGSCSVTLGALSVSATGIVSDQPTVIGTLSATLAAATLSAAGTVATPDIHGSASITLAALDISASGKAAIKGAAIDTLGALALQSGGAVQARGSLDKSLNALTLQALVFTGIIVAVASRTDIPGWPNRIDETDQMTRVNTPTAVDRMDE
jgi:hypothetical protein